MKKLCAALLAVVMLLSSLGALAEGTAQETTLDLQALLEQLQAYAEANGLAEEWNQMVEQIGAEALPEVLSAAISEMPAATPAARIPEAAEEAEAAVEEVAAEAEAAAEEIVEEAEAVVEEAAAEAEAAAEEVVEEAEAVAGEAAAEAEAAAEEVVEEAEAIAEEAAAEIEAAVEEAAEEAEAAAEEVVEEAEAIAEEAAAEAEAQELVADVADEADAQRAIPANGALRTQVSYSLSADFVKAVLNGKLDSKFLSKLINSVLYVLQNGYLDVVSGERGMSIALMINSQPVLAFKGEMAADCVRLYSDLFPHHVIKVDYSAMTDLVSLLRLPIAINPPTQTENRAVVEEEPSIETEQLISAQLERTAQTLTPYWEDVMDFVQSVARTNTISEDLNSMNMELSARQVNNLLESLLGRLSRDTKVFSFAQGLVDQLNDALGLEQKVTVEGLIADIIGGIQEVRGTSNQTLATITTNRNEDGVGTIEVSALNQLNVLYDVNPNGNTVSVVLGGNGNDTTSRMADLRSGSSSNFGVALERKTNANDHSATDLLVTELYLPGTTISYRAERINVNGEDGVSHFYNTQVNVPQMGGEAITRRINTSAAQEPIIPALDREGMVEVDWSNMDSQQKMNFLADVLTSGSTALLADILRAMPDSVARLVESGSGRSTGSESFSQRLLPPDAEEGQDLTGLWTTNGGYLDIRKDGTCTLSYMGNVYEAAYVLFNGVFYVSQGTVFLNGAYTDNQITLNIGFETVVFNR